MQSSFLGAFLVWVMWMSQELGTEAREVSMWYLGASSTQSSDLATLQQHTDAVSRLIVYCGYSLGTNGNLNASTLFSQCDTLWEPLQQMGIATSVVINTPDVPGNGRIDAFRKAFADPTALAAELAALATSLTSKGVSGFNLDLEPWSSSTEEDAAGYANLLRNVSAAVKAVAPHWRVTACGADWTPMLSAYKLLGSSCDRVLDMETYNGDSFAQWSGWYNNLMGSGISLAKTGVGLGCWVDKSTNNTWAVTNASAVERIDKVLADNVPEIAMFRFLGTNHWPESFWWPEMARFKAAP